MNAKDTVVGTAKQIVAEIVGDGRLAEEGSRQAGGNDFLSTSDADADFIRRKVGRRHQTSRSPKRRCTTTKTGSPRCWDMRR